MTYDDFYKLADYMNDSWKGGYTYREVANRAFDLYIEAEESVKTHKIDTDLIEVIRNLFEDRCAEADAFAEDLMRHLRIDHDSFKARTWLMWAFDNVRYAITNLHSAVTDYEDATGECINDNRSFVDYYPFDKSLEEAMYDVSEWTHKSNRELLESF